MPHDASYFKNWYETNKQKISDKRRKKYAEDKQHREKCIKASRDNRAKGKPSKPSGFDLTLEQAANQLGITSWALREWKRKDYFPSPLSHGGRIWFRQEQIDLLKRLSEFFGAHGTRINGGNKGALENEVNFIFANWQFAQ